MTVSDQNKFMKRRYYLRATGNVCYDLKGVTFPVQVNIPFPCLAAAFTRLGFEDPCWERLERNQPEVLTFISDEPTALLFERVCNVFYTGFVVTQAPDRR